MTEITPIANETLEVLKKIPTQTLIDGLWVKGWPSGYVEGAKPLQLGQSMAGRAVTLRFVPHRPDIAQDKPKKEQSAEYVAIELCGPNEVLVIDAMGWQYSSIGGDIKFMRLMQLQVGGLVTDGGVRDSVALKEYGFPVYSAAKTAKQGPADFWPSQLQAGKESHPWNAENGPMYKGSRISHTGVLPLLGTSHSSFESSSVI